MNSIRSMFFSVSFFSVDEFVLSSTLFYLINNESERQGSNRKRAETNRLFHWWLIESIKKHIFFSFDCSVIWKRSNDLWKANRLFKYKVNSTLKMYLSFDFHSICQLVAEKLAAKSDRLNLFVQSDRTIGSIIQCELDRRHKNLYSRLWMTLLE